MNMGIKLPNGEVIDLNDCNSQEKEVLEYLVDNIVRLQEF